MTSKKKERVRAALEDTMDDSASANKAEKKKKAKESEDKAKKGVGAIVIDTSVDSNELEVVSFLDVDVSGKAASKETPIESSKDPSQDAEEGEGQEAAQSPQESSASGEGEREEETADTGERDTSVEVTHDGSKEPDRDIQDKESGIPEKERTNGSEPPTINGFSHSPFERAKETSSEDSELRDEGGEEKEGLQELDREGEDDKEIAEPTVSQDAFQELQQKYISLLADFDNYKKRVIKEKEDIRSYGIEELVKELLMVVDNLERALQHAGTNDNIDSIKEGVILVLRQFQGVLEKFGIKPIEVSNGEKFDPRFHQAIEHVESKEITPGLILSEIVKGYTMKEKLLRPSLVAVSKAKSSDDEQDKEGE